MINSQATSLLIITQCPLAKFERKRKNGETKLAAYDVLILKAILVQNTKAQNSGMFQTFHFLANVFFQLQREG